MYLFNETKSVNWKMKDAVNTHWFPSSQLHPEKQERLKTDSQAGTGKSELKKE
jgi:hypothetical protein